MTTPKVHSFEQDLPHRVDISFRIHDPITQQVLRSIEKPAELSKLHQSLLVDQIRRILDQL